MINLNLQNFTKQINSKLRDSRIQEFFLVSAIWNEYAFWNYILWYSAETFECNLWGGPLMKKLFKHRRWLDLKRPFYWYHLYHPLPCRWTVPLIFNCILSEMDWWSVTLILCFLQLSSQVKRRKRFFQIHSMLPMLFRVGWTEKPLDLFCIASQLPPVS